MTDPFEEEQVQFERCVKPTFGDGISYSDIATKLLKENFLLTALELHTELVEAGRELPKLKEFFSNPGNFEQASLRPENLPSIPRSSSQATLDSLDLTRYSEDGERGVDERVAVLEFELRKAKETISALRANLTVATESEATTPDTGSVKPLHNESIKPHEQRALNFLINEYLLLHGYKLTSITFADENEHQDFEDWDDVGLNIPKPAEVLTLYRDYMRHAQAPCSDMEVQTDNLPSDTQLQQLQLAVEQLEVLKLEKRELEQRLWSSESRMEEVSNLTTPGSDVGGVITENISTHSDTPERFELIDAEMKGGEDLDNSRVEDDGSAVVSLAGTDVGWTRVSQAGAGTGHSPPTPAGSSDENLAALLNTPISRSVPAPFQKEVLARCFVTSRPQDGNFIEEILNDGISEERLVYILGQSLPRIIPNVILNKREELLPLIISTIHLHPEASERDKLLHLLFNLKKRPHEEERRMILTGIVGIARCSGLSLVENEILPQCWEQISHKHLERRLLVAESCSALAPYVSSSIRNSLMLSMLQQMLLEDKDEMVREVVVRSLALIVTFMDDKDKYYQCEELSMTALDDPSPSVVGSATRILLPVLAKWSLELDRLQASLITHLIQRLKSQTKPSPVESPGKQGLDSDQQMAWTLTVIQTLLPYLVMSVVAVEPVLSTITSDTTIVEPSEVFDLNNGLTNPAIFYEGEYPVSLILGAFDSYVDKEWQEGWPQMDWITSTLLPELLDVLNCTQVNRELVVATFIKMFRYISAGFGRAFIKHKVKPVFAERLQILEKSLTDSRSSIWPSLTIIPVYLVGILAARRDQEFTDELEGLLKRFVCALPVCGAPIHTLEVTIRCLCENTALHETVLAALWEGVVHPRAPVRSSAAILFVSVIGHVSEVLVASRIAPALVTLASDPDISVRTSTIPAFGSLITNTTMKEVQDKTYMQLQSFLSDPSTRDNHTMLVQLVVTMGHIVSSCETWFREEVILPQLAAMSAYTLQSSNQTRRLDLAVALIEAFSSAVYCSLSKQTISTVLLPGLRYLEPITSQFLLAHHDTIMAMIKGAESRVEPHQPIERSGSVSLATATANVGQGMEDMKQKVTKYFQSKPNINRQTNLPHLPALFRKK